MNIENQNIKEKDSGGASGQSKSDLYGWLLVAAGLVFFLFLLFGAVPMLKSTPIVFKVKATINDSVEVSVPAEKELRATIVRLHTKLDKLTPGGAYLVINTSDNHFFFYKGRELVREGLCSTGSYVKLQLNEEKNWIFETPKGVFTIRGKITSPVWRKPDWAFAEEGLPIPPANDPSRYEYGVLGDYALDLGKGYLIHGTLYKRFLGLPVTHGCVRMNDEDLEFVYNTLPIGAKVFIY